MANAAGSGGKSAARLKRRNESKMIMRQPIMLISILTVIVLLLLFVIYPLVKILLFSLTDASGTFSLATAAEIFSTSRYLKTFGRTMVLGVIVAVIATFIGYIFAYTITRTNVPCKGFLKTIATLPILSPPFILCLSIIFLFGRQGLITNGLLKITDNDVYGMGSLIVVQVLRKALADYTVSKNSPAGIDPTVDKTELIQRIRTVIGETDGFLAEHGFRLQELVDAQDFEKMNLVQDAANAMCETLETKKTFQTYASELARLFRYADRDDVDDTVRARKNAILAIYEGLQQKRKHADNTDLMVQINGIVNEYIHVEKPDQEAVPSRQFDISKIDFELLSREFAHTRRKNLLLRDLDELVNQQLAKMLFANPQRIDYYDRYQEIIDAYNAEQNRATIEKTFMDLMELASSLDTEQQRYVREGFSSDEELSVYDLLFSENLTKQEIETIKKVSVDLLIKIKQQIAKLDHWTDKQETKAIVDNLIRNTLWQELPNSYDVSDIQTYQKKIYEYVYMRYPEVA